MFQTKTQGEGVVCVMKKDRTRFDLSTVKAAWSEQISSAPRLTETWLKAATQELEIEHNRTELRTATQCLLGVALSAAVSMLIFFSGPATSTTSYGQATLYYLASSSYFSFMLGDNR